MRKLAYRLMHCSLRDALAIGLPSVALLAFALWAAFQFVRAAPPDELTIPDRCARRRVSDFRRALQRRLRGNGIALRIEASGGAVENLQRLSDLEVRADAAFIQGGMALGKDTPGLVPSGVLYPEALWLFQRGEQPLVSLDQLSGKRVAVGAEGSGTRLLVLELLRAHGVDGAPTQLSPLARIVAAHALAQGELDAVFVVSAAQSGAVWAMFYTLGLEHFAWPDSFPRVAGTRGFAPISHDHDWGGHCGTGVSAKE